MSYKIHEKGTPVLVTTDARGVFFGYLEERLSEKNLVLSRARNVTFWAKSVKGFLGLAITGPNKECRVTQFDGADLIEIIGLTSITVCTPAAVKAWEAAPWSNE